MSGVRVRLRSRLQSIDSKLPLLASGLVLLTTLALGVTAHFLMERVFIESAGRRLHHSANAVAGMITRPGGQLDNAALATDSVLRAFLDGRATRDQALAALARQWTPADTVRAYAALVDTAGVPIVEFHRDAGGARPIWAFNAIRRGEIRDTMSMGPIEQLGSDPRATFSRAHALHRARGSGSDVIAYVVEARETSGRNAERIGNLIGRDVRFLLGQPGTPLWTDLRVTHPAPRISSGSTLDSGRVVVLPNEVGALAVLPGLRWRVWVSQPRSVILAPLNRFLLIIIPVGLGIGLVGAAVTWRLTRGITHPLAQLTEAAENIARDGGDSQMHPTVLMPISADEIARLRYAFERMARRVAERQTLELQLRHAQKMEAVGRLAGGVAHDFNNLLTAIRAYADLLLADTPEWDQRRNDLLEIRKASERAASLTSQLLAFSRKQMLQPRVLDTAEAITDLRAMLQRILHEDIRLSIEVSDGLWPVKADRGQLEQVIVNLTVNARDAMPSGGIIRIRALNDTLEHPISTRHGEVPAGQYAAISVTDTGVGMDPKTQNQVFEPFFTTKPMGHGTGLGLATVHGIVAQSGGYVTVKSAVGQGTTFTVYLPRVLEQPARSSGGRAAMVSPGVTSAETILLVEDEQSVRALARRVLERTGYKVLEAGTPSEALELARKYCADIDLVVSDVVMPEMSGPQMVTHIMEVCPDTRVLFISGYTDDEVIGRGLADPSLMLLPKPFSAQELVERVRQAIDQEPQGIPTSQD